MGTVSTTRRCPSLSAFFSMNFQNVSPGVWLCNKPVSKTPLEAVLELKKQKPALRLKSITYAGRLDPMAEGLLILLAGTKVHEKEKFLKLDKTYKVKAVLGFSSDSFDLLGLPQKVVGPAPAKKEVMSCLNSLTGPVTLPLPAFSSPVHKGKPLHVWARQNSIIELPKRKSNIHSINQLRISKVSTTVLLNYITKSISKVKGDFRQDKVLNAWRLLLAQDSILTTLSFEVSCQSGTYIRSLVHELGIKLRSGAIVYTLKRIKVGPYNL